VIVVWSVRASQASHCPRILEARRYGTDDIIVALEPAGHARAA
jgi:hypothetical protein